MGVGCSEWEKEKNERRCNQCLSCGSAVEAFIAALRNVASAGK
ncbi:hypothetical protein, unlikely [Trypanosoma brucei brucei TREU927]|uniref:Uncharacterized protein n=1 Tax=Trypanosoma brucei brucei (strain 927/4 GUTat10.1) TaxID=185431 RepID=Q38F72_TRYB2|nr:hypothetical protein, unlikely [Trypanosoma brucei brucei TREU927]EAN76548.1 hypothetical protein, unlikely [Trypanosoma brucei brucei TREU927]